MLEKALQKNFLLKHEYGSLLQQAQLLSRGQQAAAPHRCIAGRACPRTAEHVDYPPRVSPIAVAEARHDGKYYRWFRPAGFSGLPAALRIVNQL